MKLKEAREFLGLLEEEDESIIMRNYRIKFVELAYLRNTAVTHKESELHSEQLKLLNNSLKTVLSDADFPEDTMYLDPCIGQILDDNIGKSDLPAMTEFQQLKQDCTQLHQDQKSGLALRLCELSVKKCLEDDKYHKKPNLSFLRELIGDQLMRIGLVNQGLKFLLLPDNHFKNGLTLMNTRDYATAVKYFGKTLQLGENTDEKLQACLAVVQCYFLIGSFENCIDFVENIIPEVIEPGAYEADQKERKIGKVIAYCLWRVLNGNINRIVLKLKFPMSHHIISQDFSNLNEAFDEVKKYNSESNMPNELLKLIEPKPIIFEPVNMDYSEEELYKKYYEIFNISPGSLRIMKRKP